MIQDLYVKLKALRINVQLVNGNLDLEAPKGVLNNELLSEIKLHKDDLINFITTYKNDRNGYSAIHKIAPQENYPLSSSQRRLWVLSQFEEGNIAYNIPGVYVFEGRLDREAFSSSFKELQERHESLRTIFKQHNDDEIRQFILPAEKIAFAIGYHDVRHEPDSGTLVENLIQEAGASPFELSTGPLLRADLYHMEDDKWLFSYVMHHIISDGLSMNILVKELLQLYNTHIKGEASALTPLRIQYKDYAAWQQEQLSGEALQQHKDYWINQFAGGLPVLELPADHARPPMKTYNGGAISKRLDAEVSKGIVAFSQEQGCTLFMGLLAAVNALLYRYTGQEDVVIGTPVAGRAHADLKEQIGFYVNTLALRTRFSGADSYASLLANIRQVTLDAYDHQVYPFDELVDVLPVQYDLSRHPLFDVMLVVHNAETENAAAQQSLGELKISSYQGAQALFSKFDLLFNFVETGGGIVAGIQYNKDIYAQSTVEQLADHLGQLLAVMIAQPDTPIQQLDYLSAAEKQQLLFDFNNTATDFPAHKTIVDLFEEQVVKTPDNIALVFEATTLTYKELNERSNQLAGYLKATYAVHTDDLIGIKLERNEWTIIAILGVLKSGGAYLPIDPEYPQERIKHMLEVGRCKALINEEELERFRKEEKNYSAGNPGLTGSPADLAYVMYTSGSTGVPKGVMIEHRSVVRLVRSTNYVSLTGKEVLLSTGAVSFDATTFEYWGMLLNGGKLILCSKEILLDAKHLGALIKENGVDTMWFTNGWLNELVNNEIAVFSGLKTILTGGDKVSHVHINALKAAHPVLQIVHVYGPTENTTFSLSYPVASLAVDIPIGKPISNSTAYLIDPQQQLCPIGVIGEICVGGMGLARGYLHQPALTAEKFVENPFTAGEQMYRTGDLGRWLRDGNIEFIGRKDNQVKIRGFRIELGEIDDTIQSYAAVDAAVVVARPGKDLDKELVAYFVSKELINTADLRAYLGNTLPAYMLPAHFVQLEQLPLTSNGKIDRKSLPGPVDAGMETGATLIAPRNEIEAKLVLIWEEILGKGRISVKDNFFELGGHSIKATRLSSQIHKTFDVKLTIKELFTKKVLEEQAELIAQAYKTSYTTITPVTAQPDYLVSSSQRRLWVLSQFEESNIAYNIPGVYVFEGSLDRPALEQAFTGLIARHENLRTVFRENEQGEIRQFIHAAGGSGFRIAYRDVRQEQEREAIVKKEVQDASLQPFDLAAGPLLRVDLYHVEDHKWVFNYVLHHIISDGWSMDILIKELLQYYHAYTKGITSAPAPLRIQYKDYAAWQQEQLSGESLQQHKAYWLNHFAGELPVLDLPGANARPVMKTYHGDAISWRIDVEVSKGLIALSQEQGCTLFMALLAAVNALLYRYTGQEDIIIGTPVAGRGHADLEDQIGFYANTLALRARFSGTDNYKALLLNTREVTLGAHEHQVYPFDELVEGLHLKRDMSRNPLFDVQVVLNQQTVNNKEIQHLDDLKVRSYEGEILQTSRFDMVFGFFETGNGLQANIQYNSDIYAKSGVTQLADHLEQLMRVIVANPDKPLNQLVFLSKADQHQLLVAFNDTTAAFPRDQTILDLFEEQVRQHPDNIAVVHGGTTLTYKELDERSNQLAHYLRHHYHLGADDLVGIMLDRSEKMILSVLGVLKSGAAYVPVDPEYPAQRKAYIIEDTGIKVLITQTEYMFDVAYYRGPLFAIDVQLETLTESVSSTRVRPDPDHLAYVIYTSGSTGNPKGVMIEHHSLVDLSVWQKDYFKLDTTKKISQMGSFSFDGSVGESIMSLTNGCTLIIISKGEFLNLVAIINKAHIDVVVTVPSVLKQLNPAGLTGNPMIVSVGEKCSVELYDQWKDHCHFINGYGPTEYTVYSHVWHSHAPVTLVPIGKCRTNLKTYITDGSMNLLPVGVPGEIYLSGPGIARGYFNNREKTAESFRSNPFYQDTVYQENEEFVAGDYIRMYKTGDIGRWLPDGNIEFIGRKDDQVKIRGIRIELGEIETVLQDHQHIDAAIVVARSGKEGEKELIAYVVSNTTVNTSEVRSWLSSHLPDYMIPNHFVQLPALPLTPNGKIDRKNLPAPESLGLGTGSTYVAPRNETEEKMVSIWEEILGKEKIGIRDSFFELGGDSIKILRIMSEFRKKLSLEVPVADIYKNHTIEKLLEHVTNNKRTIEDNSKDLKLTTAAVNQEIAALKERILSLEDLPDKENIADIYPMSDIEKGMVFESLLNEGLGIYHDQMVRHRAFKDFKIDRFRSALALLVEKHSILRTGFNINEYESPVQIVYKEVDVAVHYEDLTGMVLKEQEAIIREFTKEELKYPFDVTKAPLWRMAAFNLGQSNIIFVFQCHHAIIDGWSDTMFLTELNNVYLNLGEDAFYKPASLRSDYKDFIIQHEIDKRNNLIKDFWQRELVDYKRLDLFGAQGELDVHWRSLDKDQLKKLEQLARNLNTTVKTISLAAYLCMLKGLNYDNDIVAGVVTNTRPSCEDSDKVLGCFLNTIPFRMIIDEDKGFDDLITRVQDKLVELKGNERLSLPEIAEIHHQQLTVGNPFFDTYFNYVDFHSYQSIKEDDLLNRVETAMTGIDVNGKGDTNTYLDFTINATGDLYAAGLFLRRKLKSGFSAKKLADLYFNILECIINAPATSISKPDYLDEEERRQLLETFNATAAAYPATLTLADLFELQVNKMPERTALVFENVSFSYRELNEQANRLASYLRSNYNIGPGDLTAIQLDRSEWLIIAILAVLKAGGAYVPIDPAYPQARIDYILEDSKCKALLDENEMTNFRRKAHEYTAANLPKPGSATDLAYVIYTSGSTGRPKGCMLEHRGVVNRIEWMWQHYNFSEQDVILQKTTFTFDVSVWEIFMPLCFGARMVLCHKDDISSPERMLSLISAQQVSCVHFVPGMLSAFIASVFDEPAIADRLKHLRLVITSGEALPIETVKNWYKRVNIPVHNLYGPTEASVDVTYYATAAQDVKVLIGRPIWNTQIYITGKKDQLLPIGVTGEICIGGIALARGYLNQLGLTSEKFVPNPFLEGERMYRTGDFGRWLPDGNIEFVGRKDDQVKVRGYRIELGEIEYALQAHAGIDDAVVIARSGKDGLKELIAYIVSKETLSTADLRGALSKVLPAYMVPGYFVQLAALPLTVNGKIDRKCLPEPEGLDMETGITYVAPRNEIEENLVLVWQEILGRESIGIKDNFFELGGHSLKAMRLMKILHQRLGINWKIQDIYNHPTIEEMASGKSGNLKMVKLNRHQAAGKSNIYFIPPVLGNSILYKPLSDKLQDKFNCYGFQYSGLEKEETLYTSIEQAAIAFSDEIVKQQTADEFIIFGYSMGAVIAFEMAKILETKFKAIRLILVDKSLNRDHRNVNISNDVNREIEWLIAQYKNLVADEDLDEITLSRFLLNNMQILNSYAQTGVIKSRIYAFESTGNHVSAGMKEWNNHTSGGIEHTYIEGGHWEALAGTNLHHFEKTITDQFSRSAMLLDQ
jgi:tyrocidine synthetase-3